MSVNRQSGRLAVILHADVAGSTLLVQKDERLAHERIQGSFQRFGDIIEQYHGRVRELRGDALLAEFQRASEAVTAALAFQAVQTHYTDQLKDDLVPKVRVGIAMGEVIVADNTVTGAGVVLAQRVEQIAEPGSVVIQSTAYETIPGRFPFEYDDLGEHEVKGFEKPVRVYSAGLRGDTTVPEPEPKSEAEPESGQPDHRLRYYSVAFAVLAVVLALTWFKPWETQEEPASVERMAFPLPDKPSIAVLPFSNMSGEAEQEYFVDGMTEDLITDLSKLPGLFVISRNSVFTYKDKPVKVRQVAEELGVRYVLEGSVRRSGESVRINAQLIDATTGGHLWAERFDGSLTDVFSLQDDITGQIVDALALSLAEDPGSSGARSISTQAYDAFLKGWADYQRRGTDDLQSAILHLQQAIQLDPNYSQAHAALAAVYWEVWNNGWSEQLGMVPSGVTEKAKYHVGEALKEPTPLGHWVASNIEISAGNYDDAVSEAQKIIALDGNNAAGYAQLANALELSGKTQQSADAIEKAVRLDPHSSALHSAAEEGDVDTVNKLIAEGINLNTKDHFGLTPLHVAAEAGQPEVTVLLIDAGADIRLRTGMNASRGPWNFTPLQLAVERGRANIVEILIDAGADVNGMDAGYGDNWPVLHFAAREGHVDIVESLIDAGADVNGRTNREQQVALAMAAELGQLAVVELLIRKGADILLVDMDGKTPLHSAAESGDPRIVRLFLDEGADIDRKNGWGKLSRCNCAAFGCHQW